MMRVAISIILVFLVIYIVPIIVYGLSSKLVGAKMPEGVSPMIFLLSILVSKLGTAIAFVLIFYFARGSLNNHWFLYAFVWWIMFVMGEIGQTIGSDYSWKEAVAGAVSETIYLPLSALIVSRLINT